MAERRRSLLATLLFFAFTAPFGIAAHLVSEFAGLRWHDDADVVLSARHGYLAIVAIGAIAVFVMVLRTVPPDARRRRISEIVKALPFSGHGIGFISLSFVLQFGFFALTQAGEGCPLCGGDVFTGAIAAAIAALLGALVVAFGQRRILEFAATLMWHKRHGHYADRPVIHNGRKIAVVTRSTRRSPFSFRYRPPPLAA